MRAPFVVVLLTLLGCRQAPEKDGSTSPDADTGGPVGSGRLQGFVRTPSGEAVPGATVTIGEATTTTNSLGFFELTELPLGEAVIHAEAPGYSSTSATRTLLAETWSYAGLTVAPAELLSWDPTLGGTIESADGVTIHMPDEGLVDSFGVPVTGPVTVALTLLNTAEAISAAPGALMADRDGQDALLKSLGMIEVRLTDEAGLPVQLAAPATISFPLADVADAADPEGYTLFGFDEETGRWQEEGGGGVTDGRFQAEVEHFSWWNYDNYVNTDQCVTGRLVSIAGPITNATITVHESLSITSGSFATDEDGRFTIGLPAASEVQLRLIYGAYTWESELFTLPDGAVAEGDRPEGCLDLGEVLARSRDDDEDGYPDQEHEGPDCDDEDADIHPGAADAPYSGIDEDCGGEEDYDQDQDSYLPDAYVGLPTVYVHGSGDLPGGDCDDEDYYTNPGRVDYCDGHDDNCSGDEADATDQRTWYQDEDGDGYGTDSTETTTCEELGRGWVEQGGDCRDTGADSARYHPGADEVCGNTADYNCDGSVALDDNDADGALACEDCDDADPAAFPGATEVCDEADNDCDGITDADAVDLHVYALDYDADGFADTTTVYTGCSVPDGYLEDTGDLTPDCDDRDPDRYPGAPEICEDDVIQDCDGTEADAVEQCLWTGDMSLGAADVKLTGVASADEAGSALDGVGDVNGDGLDDLLIGARYNDTGGAESGAAYLVLGGSLASTLSLSDADAIVLGEGPINYTGGAVSGPGDTDGDGYDDLLIGSIWNSDGGYPLAGAAHLVRGPVTGTLVLTAADAELIGETASDYAGVAVAGAGDQDGDGLPDLLVGAQCNDAGGSNAGAAYLVSGDVSGDLDLEDADARLVGVATLHNAGSAVADGGDVNGDGISDLVVGAKFESTGTTAAGAVYLVLGPVTADLSLSDADATLAGEAGDRTGSTSPGVGDYNGDGLSDLAIDAVRSDLSATNAGAVYLLSGPLSGSMDASDGDARLLGEDADDEAGSAVAALGDLDGDGAEELLVGAESASSGGSASGAAYLLYGPMSGDVSLSDAAARFYGETAGDNLGRTVAGAGDVDGDGGRDLLLGAPSFDAAYSSDGAVYLLLSGSY